MTATQVAGDVAPPITVLITDDEPLVRIGLRAVLDRQRDITVAGEAANGQECVRMAAAMHPHVVLMDLRMPILDGIEATRHLLALARPPRVVVLTTFDIDEQVYAALRVGASGFLTKDTPPEDIADAIRRIAAGDTLLAPAITRRLVEAFTRQPPPGSARPERLAVLTERELDVLTLVARGNSNAQVAASLFLSEATVKSHLTRIFTKLAITDRVQAVILAYETGLVRIGHPG